MKRLLHLWMVPAIALALCACRIEITPSDVDGRIVEIIDSADQDDDADADGSDDDNGDDDPNGGLTISGQLAGAAAKLAPQSSDVVSGWIVAQSAETKAVYRATADGDGAFLLDVPESETGNTFVVSVIGADGKPQGSVMLASSADGGVIGFSLERNIDLGTISDPANRSTEPLTATGSDTLGALLDADTAVRLNASGVPVGVPVFGKGPDALLGAPGDLRPGGLDRDRDGLIDLFDADDNGDGSADDFDPNSSVNPAQADGLTLNFFMNLKVSDENAGPFYSADSAAIADLIKNTTVITFEVKEGTGLTRTLTGARVLETPAPSYLADSRIQSGGRWEDAGFALRADGANAFEEFVLPGEEMTTGDLFAVEVSFDDSTTSTYERMINYVFKSIPLLVKVGPPGALSTFTAPATITFDGTQDLVMEWKPPTDETGAALTSLDYFFEVFYYDGAGSQINGIDGAATFATPPAGFDANRRVFEVDGDTLTLSADGTFSVQLPAGIFPSTVQTGSGGVPVTSYKVDIAAQNGGNNAALMVRLVKL